MYLYIYYVCALTPSCLCHNVSIWRRGPGAKTKAGGVIIDRRRFVARILIADMDSEAANSVNTKYWQRPAIVPRMQHYEMMHRTRPLNSIVITGLTETPTVSLWREILLLVLSKPHERGWTKVLSCRGNFAATFMYFIIVGLPINIVHGKTSNYFKVYGWKTFLLLEELLLFLSR